mgnify:CR=1 FL=1
MRPTLLAAPGLTHRVLVFTFSDTLKLLRELSHRASDGEPPASREEVFQTAPSPSGEYTNIGETKPERYESRVTPDNPPEEWQRMRSPEVLRERLGADTRLLPEVREIMLRALTRDFPPKYRELLAAYYASFVGEEGKRAK